MSMTLILLKNVKIRKSLVKMAHILTRRTKEPQSQYLSFREDNMGSRTCQKFLETIKICIYSSPAITSSLSIPHENPEENNRVNDRRPAILNDHRSGSLNQH